MIVSRQNRALKNIRALRRSKDETAILEGPHLVAEALRRGLALSTVLATPEALETPLGEELRRRHPKAILEVAPPALASVADADSPQGILAVTTIPRTGAEALPVLADAIYLYLDGIQDPGNLGALARVAEAFGVTGIALSPGCAHPNHPRAMRASAGSLLRIRVAIGVDVSALDRRLRAIAPRWGGLAAHGGESLDGAVLSPPLVVVAGAEGPGLSPAVMQRLDVGWTIPIGGEVESLNVVVATALLLHEARRRAAGSGR